MLPKILCFVDIETTGGSVHYDRVIEVGVLRVENGKITKTFKTLINPNRHIPEEIFSLTNIPVGEVSIAPYFREIADELLEILEDGVFVAHNVRFDYCFLKAELKRLGIEFSPKQICTVKLSRKLYPHFRHHNLDSIIERHNYSITNRHRAFDDAQVLWKFYQDCIKNFSEEKVFAAINLTLKRPTVPMRIKQKDLDILPETPGVYIFYGEKGVPLYVGKSINIRKRVLNHFSSDHLSSKELKIAQLVEKIETISTPGELGALIKESELVKKMQPLYNRQLRLSSSLVAIKWKKGNNDYDRVEFVNTYDIDVAEHELLLGVFKSLKQAKGYLTKICKEFELCEKLLGVESGKGECFGYRLDRCKGACKGKEKIPFYNVRFQEAFSATKVKAWPFESPILIKEKDPELETEESFLVDKWVCLGTYRTEADLQLEQEIKFDLDVYKILRTYLNNPKNSKSIYLLNDKQISILNNSHQ